MRQHRFSDWARRHQRIATLGLVWMLSGVLVSSLEVIIDPIAAWERLLQLLFTWFIPIGAIGVALNLVRTLASPQHPLAMAARHGANRRTSLALALVVASVQGIALVCVTLIWSRQICHAATESFLNRDLLQCCGIGCLATMAYMATLLAATRLGIGRMGAWVGLGVDLTLGHVNAGWSVLTPHRHVMNLLGHPGIFLVSAKASSWILFGFAALGVGVAIAKTPR